MLAEAFYLTGDIEKYGSGFRRIREELKNYPTMQLVCEEVPNGFLATKKEGKLIRENGRKDGYWKINNNG